MAPAQLPVQGVPLLQDNLLWMFPTGPNTWAAVDPGAAEAVLDHLRKSGLQEAGQTIKHLLLTHHHADHVAGAVALAEVLGAEIIGAAADAHRLPPLDRQVCDGDRVKLGEIVVEVLALPGHTTGHVGYLVADALFAGDVVFGCGCGRLFEGDGATMWQSLQRILNVDSRQPALPGSLRIFPGHEYTLANVGFALSLEPENTELLQLRAEALALLERGEWAAPTTVARELRLNPFFRVGEQTFAQRLGLGPKTAVERFCHLRELRNHYRG